MTESASNNPSFFCNSGELLWGQLHCITEGYFSSAPTPSTGGNFKYRVKAAQGQWNVGEIYCRPDREQPTFIAGFIVYHSELADAEQILKSCAKVGMSGNQSHGDKIIVYVNRYDWSFAHEISDVAEALLCADVDENASQNIRQMMGKRLILVDPNAGFTVINQFKQNLSGISKNTLIKETLKVGNEAVGVHLACPGTEYELGWMVYNASNQEELIAFVYDGAYTALEGEISLKK